MKKETKEKLQNVLEKAVAVQEVAGGNLLVLKDGQEVCYVEAGMADTECGDEWGIRGQFFVSKDTTILFSYNSLDTLLKLLKKLG